MFSEGFLFDILDDIPDKESKGDGNPRLPLR